MKIFFSLFIVFAVAIYVGFFRDGQVINKNLFIPTQSSNTSALIDYISLEKAGFIVLYDDEDGKPGEIIGNSSIIYAGEHTDLIVNFNRGNRPGEKIYGVLYHDDGNKLFNSVKDKPARNLFGEMIMVPFTIMR